VRHTKPPGNSVSIAKRLSDKFIGAARVFGYSGADLGKFVPAYLLRFSPQIHLERSVNMKRRNYLLFFAATIIALLTVLLKTAAMAQQVSGAIFTTNWNSTFVNANVYDFKEDVYLNGGPRPNAPCTAAGLPDGDYYFQVTDPSGSQLLSLDGIGDRLVTVAGGLIIGYSGPHGIGMGKCVGFNGLNITVQLYPFLPTPNPGGEYKAWMTKVGDYDITKGSFGFIPSKSKTDNFKVASPVDDSDDDGIPDADDICPSNPRPDCSEG
jgi:hypothetical protein